MSRKKNRCNCIPRHKKYLAIITFFLSETESPMSSSRSIRIRAGLLKQNPKKLSCTNSGTAKSCLKENREIQEDRPRSALQWTRCQRRQTNGVFDGKEGNTARVLRYTTGPVSSTQVVTPYIANQPNAYTDLASDSKLASRYFYMRILKTVMFTVMTIFFSFNLLLVVSLYL